MKQRTVRAALLVGALLLAMSFPEVGAQGVRVIGQIGGGNCNAAWIEGNFAYAGDGRNLVILDISDPTLPTQIGRLLLPDVPLDIEASGNLVLIAAGAGTLLVVDVSNPAYPSILGSAGSPSSPARSVHVVGNVAYVAAGRGGLQIVDFSDPTQPTIRGAYNNLLVAKDVFVSGGMAYVTGDQFAGLRILDVCEPTNPTLRGTWGGATGGYIAVSGDFAYLTTYLFGMHVFDISEPSSPTLYGRYEALSGAVRIFISNQLAYVAASSGMEIIDISNPAQPALRGSVSTPGAARAVHAAGGLAAVADYSEGMQLFNVTNPSAPIFQGDYDAPNEVHDVHVADHVAYLATSNEGFQIIDVSVPSQPALRGKYSDSRSASDVYVNADTAYLADGWNLVLLDVSDPWRPARRGAYNSAGWITDVEVIGSLAYVAAGSGGLEIVDISNPWNLQLHGSYTLAGTANGLHVSGDLVFVARTVAGGGRLEILDVSDSTSPVARGAFPMSQDAMGVDVADDLAYVASSYLGVGIIAVGDPSQPAFFSSYDTPDRALAVQVEGDLAYVADYDDGVHILDVHDPAHPRPWGTFDTPGSALALQVSEGLIYVADRDGGLWILQLSSEAPRIQSVTLTDVNNNGSVEGGDQLVLTMTRSVVVTAAAVRTSHFFLPVEGDSLGGAGFAVGTNPYNTRQMVLTLGSGAQLTPAGDFAMTQRTAGSPSGLDIAGDMPPGIIASYDGISAVDGGQQGVDDAAIDVQYDLLERVRDVTSAGGLVQVTPSADAAYTRHQLRILRGALATTTTFRLRPASVNLGVTNAVQIESSDPAVTFPLAATLRIQYREGDIDFERGQIESQMRVHQLVETPTGGTRFVPLAGTQTLDTANQEIEVELDNLNPAGSQGTIGIFAGIPVDTVDERTIYIKPDGAAGGVAKDQAGTGAVLSPGPNGDYTEHRIVFRGYSLTTPEDPARLEATIRDALLAERVSQSGGQSFPAQSGAVFVVEIKDAAGQPVEFTSPVDLTVQFLQRGDPWQSDCVRFDGWPGIPINMRLAHDRLPDSPVDFVFTELSPQVVDVPKGTVGAENLVGLTGSDGRGTLGAVARHYLTPAVHWEMYD